MYLCSNWPGGLVPETIHSHDGVSQPFFYLKTEKVSSQRIIWWRHQMETFSVLLPTCVGNSTVPGEFPTQRPVMRSFDVFFICVWINSWVNNREASDLRVYRAHYDVTVMPENIIIDRRRKLYFNSLIGNTRAFHKVSLNTKKHKTLIKYLCFTANVPPNFYKSYAYAGICQFAHLAHFVYWHNN